MLTSPLNRSNLNVTNYSKCWTDTIRARPRRAMLPMAVSDGWASIIRRLSVLTSSISSLQSDQFMFYLTSLQAVTSHQST